MSIKNLTISMHSFTFAIALLALVEELPEDFVLECIHDYRKLL